MIDTKILIEAGAMLKEYNAGEYLFREEGKCHFYFQLQSGKIKLINELDNGKEYLLEIVDSKSSFGELPLFDDLPYAISAVAIENSTVFVLEKNIFLNLTKSNPELLFASIKIFVEEIRFDRTRLKELSISDPKHKIISLINYFYKDGKHCNHAKKNIVCEKCTKLLLTRQEIADMTGLRVETVIRTLKKLEEDGKVLIDKGKVYLNTSLSVKDRCPKA